MTRKTISGARFRCGRLVAAAASALLVVAMLPGTTAAVGTIVFDGSPGINPPPATLGGFPMTPFGPDGYSLGQTVSSVPAPGGGSVGFSQPATVWNPQTQFSGGWTSGYTGHAYWPPSTAQYVLTLPAGTNAFYLYAEDVRCGTWTVTATANDGTTSGPVVISPICGGIAARYFGFYATGGAALTSITVVSGSGMGVAVGEFGINLGAPVPPPSAIPTVTSFSPGAGRVGSLVTIMGTSFSYARSVTFNGVPATFSVRSPSVIVATVPAGATTGPIRVSTPFGGGTSARSFVVLR